MKISNENMVKLFTHNLLCCAAKDCISVPKAYPLIFNNPQIVISEAEFNPAFINNMLPRIEWSALHSTVNQVGEGLNGKRGDS